MSHLLAQVSTCWPQLHRLKMQSYQPNPLGACVNYLTAGCGWHLSNVKRSSISGANGIRFNWEFIKCVGTDQVHSKNGGQVCGPLVQPASNAKSITVSEKFAREAGISSGEPAVFKTANGNLSGRIVSDVPVSMGPIDVSGVKVAVGFVGQDVGDALLGQSFLSKFEIVLQKDQMTLRKR